MTVKHAFNSGLRCLRLVFVSDVHLELSKGTER